MTKFVIGVTGQAGSGKTFAMNHLKNKIEFEYIDLDKIGHFLLKRIDIKEALITLFGNEIIENNEINRKSLGGIVFSNKEKLMQLNNIIHPHIKEETLKRVKTTSKQVVIIVGALIDEIRLLSICNKVITISALEKDQLKNLGERKRVIKHQKEKKIYKKIADYEIYNTFNKEFIDKFIILVQNLILKR